VRQADQKENRLIRAGEQARFFRREEVRERLFRNPHVRGKSDLGSTRASRVGCGASPQRTSARNQVSLA
jgi:hypothetical protein